jgi:undecaprenyl-diphosphatase
VSDTAPRDGGVEAALLLALLAWAGFTKRRAWRVTAALGLVGVVLGLAAPLFKMVLPRFRPPALYPYDVVLLAHPLYGGSFPSGHTLTAFTLATILSRRHPWTAPWAFGMATLVGISRISLGVHWPLDVLGGALLGLFFGWIVTILWSRRERNAARAANRPEPRTSPAANA